VVSLSSSVSSVLDVGGYAITVSSNGARFAGVLTLE
jgi:hypothetical protein